MMKRAWVFGIGLVCVWALALGACELFLEQDEPTEPEQSGPIEEADASPRPPGEGFVEPANCDEDCCSACSQFATCTNSQSEFEECMTTCQESVYLPSRGVHCLALRIFWINEEGCETIVPTYDSFEAGDSCSD